MIINILIGIGAIAAVIGSSCYLIKGSKNKGSGCSGCSGCSGEKRCDFLL